MPRLRFPEGASATPRDAFGHAPARLRLEIGFGAGEHALAVARDHPDDGLIACEVFANGIASLLGQLAPAGAEADGALLPSLRVWDRDARPLLRLLPQGSLAAVFLLFPDPWPKARHAKRRFVHPDNVRAVARVLKPGAEWRIATDDPTYQDWVRAVMDGAAALFEPVVAAPERPEGWPPTRYERKALREGRTPLYWRFIRRDSARR